MTEKREKIKNIVLLSGGMDSTTLLYDVKKVYPGKTVALIFDYKSKHNAMERRHAKVTCSKLEIDYRVLFLGQILSHFNSALTQKNMKIPQGHYSDQTMRKTVVPFRNGIMLSVAVGIAEDIGAKKLFIANHFGDHAVYPDCRKKFIEPFKDAALHGTYRNIEVIAPFVDIKKHQILEFGLHFGVPYEDTYSCYEGDEIHCGRCSTCYERREAFHINKANDPTVYKDKTPFEELKKEYEEKFKNGPIEHEDKG